MQSIDLNEQIKGVMSENELKQSAREGGGSKLDSIIKTVNKLHSVIQLQYSDEGDKGEHTQEHVVAIQTSVSTDVKREGEEEISEKGEPRMDRSKSAPQALPNQPDLVNPIRKLQNSLRHLKRKVKYLKSLQLEVDKDLDWIDSIVRKVEPSDRTSADGKLKDISEKVFKLIRNIPMSSERQKLKKTLIDSLDGKGDNDGKLIECLPAIHANEENLKSLDVFRDVEAKFKALDSFKKKIYLLSFAVFPENQEVNQTMLMYWWIGEGILDYKPKAKESVLDEKDRPENVVKDILNEFAKLKLIEPVVNRRKVEPNSYKMTPFVHASVVQISREMKLFDIYPKGKKPTMNLSEMNKVCLVEGSSSQELAKGNKMKAEHIETVFNVSERFPEFTRKWFTRMKHLKVLYLGRWERIHPETESERTDPEITMDGRRVMKDLGSLKNLRFLSFQGISSLKSLSRSACKLTKLIILDLRDCYNLEQLPDNIDKLKNLVYLDLTGCEALESVPLGLTRLYNLEVLKGFVLGDETLTTSGLKTLKKLEKLRKLSVTVLHREDFTLDKLIDDIEGFNALEKLKVQWGSKVSVKKEEPKDSTPSLPEPKLDLRLPARLKKLDLQRFPDKKLPECLWPQNLTSLEKLHLGSSKRLKGFGALAEKPTECGVKVIRLKSLLKLHVEWRELRNFYFPKLELLETSECPRVTFCPCDRNGIWRKEE